MAGGLDTGSKPWALGQRRPNASLVVPMVEFLENGSGEDYTLLDMSAIEVTNAEVNAEKAAEQTKGGQVMYRLRDLDVPEVAIPLLGKYTAGTTTRRLSLPSSSRRKRYRSPCAQGPRLPRHDRVRVLRPCLHQWRRLPMSVRSDRGLCLAHGQPLPATALPAGRPRSFAGVLVVPGSHSPF
jgi:hypothetical protein